MPQVIRARVSDVDAIPPDRHTPIPMPEPLQLDAFPELPGRSTNRIRGVVVPAFFPESGTIHTFIYGEAPGPRGADQSGVPFWGDGAGLPLYRALTAAACAVVPNEAWSLWDGAAFVTARLRPVLRGVGLSNAFPRCPSNDGRKFRAPSKAELSAPDNRQRIVAELEATQLRGLRQVVALGRCARETVGPIAATLGIPLIGVPHPAAQGLLADAPNRGRGMRIADLQSAWQERLIQLLS